MKNSIKKLVAQLLTYDSINSNRKLLNAIKKMGQQLPTRFKMFEHTTTVTFSLTTQEQNVSHAKFPELMGNVRELFAIDGIPNFIKEVGSIYLLKTRYANYVYLKDFVFGEEMLVKMFVSKVEETSFDLIALFIGNNEIKTIGEQKIIYNNMQGLPIKMPGYFKTALESVCVEVK